MNLSTPISRVMRNCAIVPVFAIAACGGGTSTTPEPPPVQPPANLTFSNFQAASAVLGQASLGAGEPNQGQVPGAQTLSAPRGMAAGPDGKLLVADSGNNRVLLFASSSPTQVGQAATAVLGQTGFQGVDYRLTQDGLNAPFAVAYGVGKVAVADWYANRVLVYNQIPREGETVFANVVIGQRDYESSLEDCGPAALDRPTAVAITPDGKLIVSDSENNRVLIWDAIPEQNESVPAPSVVLGQSDADHCAANDDDQRDGPDMVPGAGRQLATARTLSQAGDVWSDGRRLAVADTFNHRVLIWETFPTHSFQPADIVLGHESFTNTEPNSERDGQAQLDQPTARTLFFPSGVHSDGSNLAIADTVNNRVLIWNSFPSDSFQAADVVLGHLNFNQKISNDQDRDSVPDAATSQVLYNPDRVLFTSDALLVSDRRHNRILIFRGRD